MTDRRKKVLIDHFENGNDYTISFNKYWSASLYPCQTMSVYGVMFPKLPSFKVSNRNTSTIWAVASLLTRIEILWQLIDGIDKLKSSQWYGWMLVYLMKNCFSNVGDRRQVKLDPFKNKYMRKYEDICKRMSFESITGKIDLLFFINTTTSIT